MPYSCSVPKCDGNYRNGPKVSIYSFPRDENLRSRWIAAIKRNGFNPNKYSKVCERHFEEDDFITEASGYDEKKDRWIFVPLKIRKLKKDAVPSVFVDYSMNSKNRFSRKRGTRKRFISKPVEDNVQVKKESNPSELFDFSNDSYLKTSSTSVKQEIDPSLVEPIVKIKEEPVDDYPDPSTSVDNASEEFILPDKNNSWALTDSVVLPQVILSVASLASPNKPETSDAQQPKKKPRTNSSETEVTSPNDAEVRTQNPELNFECITNPSSSTTYCIDQFDAFGVYVATKLRSFDAVSSSFVQKAIRDLILEAEMGKYRNQSQGLKS